MAFPETNRLNSRGSEFERLATGGGGFDRSFNRIARIAQLVWLDRKRPKDINTQYESTLIDRHLLCAVCRGEGVSSRTPR